MKPNKTVVIIMIALTLLVCCWMALLGLGFAGRRYLNLRTPQGVPTLTIKDPALPSRTPSPVNTPQLVVTPSAELSPDTLAQMNRIQSEVSAIRDLQTEFDVPRKVLSADELAHNVSNDFFSEYSDEQARRDAKTLFMLGLLPQDFDLINFYKELYNEQLLGYYDNEEKAMFIIGDDDFNIMKRSTYAHEYTHALQDGNFDFNGKLGIGSEDCKNDSEHCSAMHALIEGDATLTETLWLEKHASREEIAELIEHYQGLSSPVYDAAPPYFQKDFLFSYQSGIEFVQSLYSQGKFALVDKAYTSEHPVSTEQILHPSRYPDDKPKPVFLPDLSAKLGSEWVETDRDTFGEWFSYLILTQAADPKNRLADQIGQAAAEGWGGDTFVQLENSKTGEMALIVRYVWDDSREAKEAESIFSQYLGNRFKEQSPNLYYDQSGFYVRHTPNSPSGFTWIFAETQETLNAILDRLH
ncbi:MAG: hypothetical protein ACOYKD_07465 [Anaerolineaceae bacterium]|jgi:Zn-dependent peptidase ImmA (M78 family)